MSKSQHFLAFEGDSLKYVAGHFARSSSAITVVMFEVQQKKDKLNFLEDSVSFVLAVSQLLFS